MECESLLPAQFVESILAQARKQASRFQNLGEAEQLPFSNHPVRVTSL
jgi:hypothetical protein